MRSRDKLRLLQGYEPKQDANQRVEKENNGIVNVSYHCILTVQCKPIEQVLCL